MRFVDLIVDELTANGVMEPRRLYESPYPDHAPTGPDQVFPDAHVDVIVDILDDIRQHAVPTEAAYSHRAHPGAEPRTDGGSRRISDAVVSSDASSMSCPRGPRLRS